jgi:hypothetical protein
MPRLKMLIKRFYTNSTFKVRFCKAKPHKKHVKLNFCVDFLLVIIESSYRGHTVSFKEDFIKNSKFL